MNSRHTLIKYIFTLTITIAIIILSIIPTPEVEPLTRVPLFDKWVHFVMYGSLTCAMWIDYRKNKNRNISLKFCALSIVYPSLVGGLMEIVQEHITTYRSGDIIDFYADVVGTIIGLILSVTLFTTHKKIKHRHNG